MSLQGKRIKVSIPAGICEDLEVTDSGGKEMVKDERDEFRKEFSELSKEQQDQIKDKAAEVLDQIMKGVESGKTDPLILLGLVSNDETTTEGIFQWCRTRAYDETFQDETSFTKHQHQCPIESCNTVWTHDPMDTFFMPMPGPYERSHRCPKCGTEQYELYHS